MKIQIQIEMQILFGGHLQNPQYTINALLIVNAMVNPKQKLIITNDNTNEYTNPNSDRNTETNLRSPRPVLPLLIINCNGQSAGGES